MEIAGEVSHNKKKIYILYIRGFIPLKKALVPLKGGKQESHPPPPPQKKRKNHKANALGGHRLDMSRSACRLTSRDR